MKNDLWYCGGYTPKEKKSKFLSALGGVYDSFGGEGEAQEQVRQSLPGTEAVAVGMKE